MKTKKTATENQKNTLAPPPLPPPGRTAGGSNHPARCPARQDFGWAPSQNRDVTLEDNRPDPTGRDRQEGRCQHHP